MIKAIAMIRKLDKTEYDRATSLALEVYIQCGAEDFDEEGLNSFKSFIFSEQLMNELVIYGAFDNENLVGIMGTKNEGKHLSLFFIGKEHHRKGIGKPHPHTLRPPYKTEPKNVDRGALWAAG